MAKLVPSWLKNWKPYLYRVEIGTNYARVEFNAGAIQTFPITKPASLIAFCAQTGIKTHRAGIGTAEGVGAGSNGRTTPIITNDAKSEWV